MNTLGSALQRAPAVVAAIWFSLASLILPLGIIITTDVRISRALVIITAGLGIFGGIMGAIMGRRILKPESTTESEKAVILGTEVLLGACLIVYGLIFAYDTVDTLSGGALRSIDSISRIVHRWIVLLAATAGVIGALAGWWLFAIRKKYVDPPAPDEAP